MEFECKKCKKSFPEKRQVKQHLQKRHKIPMMCSICLAPANNIQELNSHKENIHGIKKSCKCELCGMSFTTKWNMLYHMDEFHNGKGKRKTHNCEKCNKEFISRSSMKVHQEKCGLKLPTECDICKKSFKSHGNMLIHKRRGHSQRKDYACEICNEEFPFEKWLKAHRKFHNEIETEIKQNAMPTL